MKYDLTGRRFTRWVVIERAANIKTKIAWLCKCDCGNTKIVVGASLTKGVSGSCGCLSREIPHTSTHLKSNTSTYRIWSLMKARCHNENNPGYKWYGGRGIKVCDRWRNSFENFLQDMGERPSPKHSIDRKNNDGNYEPGNCRWATAYEQSRNRSQNRYLTINGETKVVADWTKKFNVSRAVLLSRIFPPTRIAKIDYKKTGPQPKEHLTESQMNEVKELYARGGMTHSSMAEKFNVPKSYIHQILNNLRPGLQPKKLSA